LTGSNGRVQIGAAALASFDRLGWPPDARGRVVRFMAALPVLLLSLPAGAVEIHWVAVRDAGNAADTQVMTCCGGLEGGTGFGSVGYDFAISRYEITNGQYAEFLNQVAKSDPGGLYNDSMGSDATHGGIDRTGSDGSYAYAPKSGFEEKPVVYVSFWDVLRFANWLDNGQPAGPQGPATTEDGAYTLTPGGISGNSVVRNAGARVFLTSEDEWYKAAYYDPALGGTSRSWRDRRVACAGVTGTARIRTSRRPSPASARRRRTKRST
jgi:hypothetical protein